MPNLDRNSAALVLAGAGVFLLATLGAVQALVALSESRVHVHGWVLTLGAAASAARGLCVILGAYVARRRFGIPRWLAAAITGLGFVYAWRSFEILGTDVLTRSALEVICFELGVFALAVWYMSRRVPQ